MVRNLAQKDAAERVIVCRSQAREGFLAILRDQIAKLEAGAPLIADPDIAATRPESWRFGLDPIDARLPAEGLDPAGIHEIAPNGPGDMAAAMGFAMALSLRRQSSLRPDQQPWLWCRSSRMAHEHGGLYGHGIEIMGLSASRVVTAVLGKHTTILWMVEEALKSAALSCVIADINPEKCSLTAMQRLALAARAGQTPALLVLAGVSDAASPARSRWRVGSLPSLPQSPDERAPGNPAWSLELTRCRRGKPGIFLVEWDHATNRFALAADVSGGTAVPRKAEGWEAGAAAGGPFRLGQRRG